MAVPDWPQNLTTSKCSKLTRPLIAKIHSLTDLFAKDPALFAFDNEKCAAMSSRELSRFLSPKSSEHRLTDLQPFILHELYEAYRDIFLNFKSIVCFVYQLNFKKSTIHLNNQQDSVFIPKSSILRLSTLSALQTGKHIALGTKSTFLLVSQAMAFDKETFPAHLLKYSQGLEDGIESWLDMEPVPVFNSYRKTLLMGYLVHLLVINLTTLLYTLIPVLAHWLKEQGIPFLSSLFYAYWNFLISDPAVRVVGNLLPISAVANSNTFWTFHRNGYWRQYVELLNLENNTCRPDIYDPYDGLFLDAVSLNNRISALGILEIYHVMRRNSQYPSNTSIVMIIAAQIIDSNYRLLKSALSSRDAITSINTALSKIFELLQYWIALDNDCIYHHLDRGNERIFDSILRLLNYNFKHASQVLHCLNDMGQIPTMELAKRQFMNIKTEIRTSIITVELLKNYHLDRPHVNRLQGISSERVANCLWNLLGNRAENRSVLDLVDWLHEQNSEILVDLAESIFDQFGGLVQTNKRIKLS